MSPLVFCACLLLGQVAPPPLPPPPDTPAVKQSAAPREIHFEDLVRRAYGNDAFVDEALTNKQVVVTGIIHQIKRLDDQSYEVHMRTTLTWLPDAGDAYARFHFKASQRETLAELPTGPDQQRVRISGKCLGCITQGGWLVNFTDCQVAAELAEAGEPTSQPNTRNNNPQPAK